MFSKYVAILSFAASAIAGVVTPGTYRIVNVASGSTVRAYYAPGPLFVSSTRENAGWFELVSPSLGHLSFEYTITICLKPQWDIKDAKDGGYTIANVGLNMQFMLDTSAAVFSPDNGEPVFTNRVPTVFNIESAGNGEYEVRLASLSGLSGTLNHLLCLAEMYVVLNCQGSFLTPSVIIYPDQTPACEWRLNGALAPCS
ncbi:hypothetical protein BYT27DRAFT_7186593 [Phlegmacium glaucopus]|nr:hypothetical protein BYT27DRAFT_7186593 [Phlegmacium glaucopus]